MKTKSFILTFLMMMFCSVSFGQNSTGNYWNPDEHQYSHNMDVIAIVKIDGVEQTTELLEVGAFCGTELRASSRLMKAPMFENRYIVFLDILGGETGNELITFKLYDHSQGAELNYVINKPIEYKTSVGPIGTLDDPYVLEFVTPIAKLNGVNYGSLQDAIDACTTGNNTIELLADNAEDVTIKQVEGVNITIDGGDNNRYDYSGTITIHGNARYQGEETLTFTKIDFTTDKAGHYFIDSNSTDSDKRYAHNVTVSNCNFTATGAGVNSAVAMRIRQGFDIAINGGTFTDLHSALQAYGNAGINITGIESNCKNGISVGSSTNVVITGSDITATGATGYGVRAGENVTGPITITGTEINAFIPVSVRKVTDDTNCEFTFTGNTMTASNTDGYWCVIGTSEYEANGSLSETAGKIIVNATEQDLAGVYGYSRVEVTFADSTTKYFYMMEDAVPYNNADNYEGATIKLLSNCAGRGLRFWENDMTFDLNGKKYTITQAVGSSGTESQGFQIRPEVIGNVTITNGTIDIKAGTNVKWMFNSYAADFVVKDVTIDGTNMVTSTNQDYLLVVQNAGDKATFENVTIQNYDAKKVYLEGNTTFVTPQQFDNSIVIPDGYVLEYENGAYIVKAGNVLNETKDKKYATLAEAIAAADSGDKLVLLADITENVTVNKNVTIDGANDEGGKFDYTGTMIANNGLTVTVQNIDFVGGGFDKSNKSTTGNYTIKNCTFEDDGDYAYPVRIKGASSVTIEDCTVKNYMYSFLYITSGTNKVSVKNVTVEDCSNYAVYFASGVNTATIENLTVKNADRGLLINNTANRALTLINCKLENVGTAVAEASGTNTITCTLLGNENDFGTSASSQYAKYVLAAADATLTAPEGYTVTTTVENSLVKYVDGAYKVVPAVAKIGDVCYETLADAVEAATAGQTVELIADATGAGLKINKDITVDFGGKTYTINQAVGSTGTESQGFQLLKNNTVTLRNGNIAIAENTNVKWMFNAYADVTLENLNVNCANMAAPAENEANYVLVVNNGGSATPTVTYTNVIVTNFPSTATAQIWLDPRTTLKAGADLESSIETEEGYVVVYNNGEYTAIGAVAKIGEAIYPSVAAAVAAAQAGDVIELLVNVTEDVTVDKSVTIDGANKNYTGTMTVNKSLIVTVQNVNFVKGCIDKAKGTSGTLTVKDCNFDGVDDSINYAVTMRGGNSVTIEGGEVKNYGYGMLYVPSAVSNVTVKDTEVDGVNYGVHVAYGSKVNIEGVTMTNMAYGIMTQNYGAKTITIKNSSISGTNPIHVWERNTTVVDTFNFIDANTLSDLTTSAQAKLVLGNENALTSTLTAPEGFNVTTSVAGHIVDYADGKYYLRVPNYVAAIGETKYESLQAAINAAVDNDVVVVLADIEVNIDNVEGLPTVDGHPTYYEVTGKTISIDLNGMTIKANVTATDLLLGLFSTEQNGNLTFIDSSNGSGTVEVVASDDANVYALITNYEETSSITINNGNYRLNKTGINGQSLIYDSPGNMVINGGNFHLGNIGTDGVNNGLPWIFNCYGKDQGNVTVKGGTFNADVNHQHWAHEVYVPNTLALKDNGNGTWTVVDAVAQGTDSWRGYNRSLGYASIADAAYWAKAESTITVVKDHSATTPAVVESNLTIDLEEKTVTAVEDPVVYPVIRIQNNANVTIKNGTITNEKDYVFVLGASDGSSAGNLTIESGVYTGTTTVASVTKGLLTINGGEFKVNDSEYGATYMINCIDANYNDDSANVKIYGGKFYGFNPEDNAAEGAGTNFCAEGYGAVETETGSNVWRVVPMQGMQLYAGWNWFSSYIDINGEEGMSRLQEALNPNGVQIKGNKGYTQYTEGYGWYSPTLTSVSVKEMYMINMSADHELQLAGDLVDPEQNAITLSRGWNWIGYQLNQQLELGDALSQLDANHGDFLKTTDGIAEYYEGYGWWGTLNNMTPGIGYMYYNVSENTNTFTYSYPEEGSKSEVRANITSENNYWVPVSAQYAKNMNIIAVVDGMKGDDYEVAAFVGDEVRGSARPIYVEPLDAYMFFLTIHGDEVEEMSFKVYDLATGEEFDLNNRMSYSNDAVVGSIGNPYLLSRGTTGIGETSSSEINVYPNPTTIGTEINLGTVCDTVEVFNALGVKVAEYQNVDSVDALETAGIYVIRITNDGNVQNCRLVVK